MPVLGGELDEGTWPYRASRAPRELWKSGGEPLMGMAPFAGDAWFAKNGSDLVHSLVYCAAVLVAPRADSRGEVVALYAGGPVGDAEEKRFAVGGDLVLVDGEHSC